VLVELEFLLPGHDKVISLDRAMHDSIRDEELRVIAGKPASIGKLSH